MLVMATDIAGPEIMSKTFLELILHEKLLLLYHISKGFVFKETSSIKRNFHTFLE